MDPRAWHCTSYFTLRSKFESLIRNCNNHKLLGYCSLPQYTPLRKQRSDGGFVEQHKSECERVAVPDSGKVFIFGISMSSGFWHVSAPAGARELWQMALASQEQLVPLNFSWPDDRCRTVGGVEGCHCCPLKTAQLPNRICSKAAPSVENWFYRYL